MSLKGISSCCASPAFLVSATLLSTGCDPAGPGAAGTIELAEEAVGDTGLTLELRAYPDIYGSFDPLHGVPPRDETAWSSTPLDGVLFPYEYEVSEGLGTTGEHRWRVLAWIAETGDNERPLSGEWFGTAVFDVGDCGGTFDGYCDVTDGVHFRIEHQVP